MKKKFLLLLLIISIFCLSLTNSAIAADREKYITINLNTDFVTAVRAIASYADVEIIVNAQKASSVKITANIKHQPIKDVLYKLSKIAGYDCVIDNGVYYIGDYADVKRLNLSNSKTETVPLKYIQTTELSESLRKETVPENVTISLNKSNNSVLITGPDHERQQVKELIKTFDKELPQIAIDAKVIEINNSDASTLGFLYNDSNSLVSTSISESSLGNHLSFGTFTRSLVNFDTKLEALVTKGKAKIICNPNIVTLHNKEANIVIGENIPYLTVNSVNGGSQQNTSYLDTGVNLKVTPIVCDDNSIKLKTKIEISEQTGTEPSTKAPITSERMVETELKVLDNMSIVIGGLKKENHTELRKKIPLLGDLPLIKGMFRWSETSSEQKEIIVILTPKIVQESGLKIPEIFKKEFPDQTLSIK